jgi:hypothetical protein
MLVEALQSVFKNPKIKFSLKKFNIKANKKFREHHLNTQRVYYRQNYFYEGFE